MATAALGELSGVGTDHLHSSTPLLTSQVPSSTPYSNKGHLAAMAARRNGWGMAHNGLEYMSSSFAGLGGHICNGSRASGPAVEHAASGEVTSTGFPRNVWERCVSEAARRPHATLPTTAAAPELRQPCGACSGRGGTYFLGRYIGSGEGLDRTIGFQAIFSACR